MVSDKRYEVALSFAGENRDYARELAYALKARGISVFYDEFEKTNLWGKNLNLHLADIYENKSDYVVIFLSHHYATKIWTNHELSFALARALRERQDYILPVRLDDTRIQGINPNICFLSQPPETAESIADEITKKLDKTLVTLTSINSSKENLVQSAPLIKLATQFGATSLNSLEKKLIETEAFLRLRYMHHFPLHYLTFPLATYSHYEFSFGLIGLANRIYDSLLSKKNLNPIIKKHFREELELRNRETWRQVVRASALLNYVGRLPLQDDIAESLLPHGCSISKLTAEIIRESEIGHILTQYQSPIHPETVIGVALDTNDYISMSPEAKLNNWLLILNNIIHSPIYGAAQILELTAFGNLGFFRGYFDLNRLISSLRIVTNPNTNNLEIGVHKSAVSDVQGLLFGRRMMLESFSFHKNVRAVNFQLREFLRLWLPKGRYSGNWKDILQLHDHSMIVALEEAKDKGRGKQYKLAKGILDRSFYRPIFKWVSGYRAERPTMFEDVMQFINKEYEQKNVLADPPRRIEINPEFLVIEDDGTIHNSDEISRILAVMPPVEVGSIMVDSSTIDIRQAREKVNKYVQTLRNAS